MRSLARRGGGAMQPWTGGFPMANLLDDLRTEFDRFFREAEGFLPTSFNREDIAFVPPVDIQERGNEYQIKAELPGIDPQDVDVRVEGNTLIIRGERKQEEEETGTNFFRRERNYGSFMRAFTLPETIDADHIKATAKGGLLTITVPKTAPGRTSRVEVQSEEGRTTTTHPSGTATAGQGGASQTTPSTGTTTTGQGGGPQTTS